MFIDRLIGKVLQKRCHAVVGLDTCLEFVPGFIREKYFAGNVHPFEAAGMAIAEFNREIIDAVHELVPAVKVQIAFYEQYGISGLQAYLQTIKYAKEKGLLVIGDVKRSDIAHSAAGYARAHLGRTMIEDGTYPVFDCDAVTLNPYIGADSITPFIEECGKWGKGAFVLVKTSNPSSADFQDLEVGERKLYEVVALKVEKWGQELVGKSGYSGLGAVVGATYPKQAEQLRRLIPRTYFLVPGYGSQGAGAEDLLPCFNQDGLGAIVNSSRKVLTAYLGQNCEPKEFAKAARKEVLRMRDEINGVLKAHKCLAWEK